MVLILGAKGMLGGQLMKVFGNEAVGWDRTDMDVTKFKDLRLKIEDLAPETIVNCVAFNDVDGAESSRELAFKLNADVPKNLAEIANAVGSVLVHFSTNFVFDGQKDGYKETDEPHPLSVYAQSKYRGEQAITANCRKYYLIRTALLFGPKGESELSKKSFVDLMLELSNSQREIKAVGDEINSLTYSLDLAAQIKLLLNSKPPYGIYHITNSGQASWHDLAKEIFDIAKKKINLVKVLSSEFPRKAVRPKKGVLINTKLPPLRPWQEALREFLNQES